MPYTDLWRCKHCNVLPDIQMMGRSFLIACEGCDHRDSRVEADSLGQVVSIWNEMHAPPKPAVGLMGRVQEWLQILKDYAEYHRDCFREKRERSARLKRTVREIRQDDEAQNESEALLDEDLVQTHENQESRSA